MTFNNNCEKVLEDALNLYWLRPENALALASYVKYGTDISPPSKNHKYADLACGDGINTFFKCGGRFSADFDVFMSGIAPESTVNIANHNIDVYDYYIDSYSPIVTNHPTCNYHLGTDHKNNLLQKAEKLNFYYTLLLKDLREEIAEINDHSLDAIYCNSLYWIKETELSLTYMKKKLNDKGKIILDVFTDNKVLLDWGNIYPKPPKNWQQLLNRGRQDTNPGLRNEKDWEYLFNHVELEIVEKNNILPSTISLFWNLGLRPVFPMLNKMTKNISNEKRLEIKKEWVEVFKILLLPILKEPEYFSNDKTVFRLQYVLKPKSGR